MDLRFSFAAIFLILDAIFIRSTGSKGSDVHNSSKKKNSIKIQLSGGIANNPFLQQPVTLPSVEGNPFLLPSPGNKHENQSGIVPNISLTKENQSSSVTIFPTSNNPFFGTDIRIETEPSKGPHPPGFVTNIPFRPSPTYETGLPIKTNSVKARSELKCEEYTREIVGSTEIVSLVGTSSNVIKVDNICRDANRLVIGGTEAKPGEFPHMVALGRLNSDETFVLICGATLISHTWVLSAAHCTYGPNGSPSHARIGFHRLTDQQSGVIIAIKDMIRHPDYIPPAMYADIALLKLVSAVTFSLSTIRPACLYQEYDTVPTTAWISGWGVTEFAGDQTDRLQKAQLELISNLDCTLQYNSSREVPHGVTPSMICAGDPRDGWTKDSCQGDSGGPLQVIHPINRCFFQVIGITSFGQGCAAINIPGVYTRVSHYIPWIENIVWPQKQ